MALTQLRQRAREEGAALQVANAARSAAKNVAKNASAQRFADVFLSVARDELSGKVFQQLLDETKRRISADANDDGTKDGGP